MLDDGDPPRPPIRRGEAGTQRGQERLPACDRVTRRGRPDNPLLVDEIARDIIVEAVGNGASFSAACAAAGLDRGTAYRWIRDGERLLAEQDKAYEEGQDFEIEVHLLPYAEFVTALRDAKDRGTVALLKGIRKHVESDWRSAAWLLAHTRGAEFADQAKLAHAGPDGGPLQVEHMSDAEVIAAVLERADQYAIDRGLLELDE